MKVIFICALLLVSGFTAQATTAIPSNKQACVFSYTKYTNPAPAEKHAYSCDGDSIASFDIGNRNGLSALSSAIFHFTSSGYQLKNCTEQALKDNNGDIGVQVVCFFTK